MTTAYVDASALAKLIRDEPGSPAMRRWFVEADRLVCSRLGLIETRRAVRRAPHDSGHLETILGTVEVFELDVDTARQAAAIGPPGLRTLDAIHLASAAALAGDLDAFVTYDLRLAEAARAAGLPVVSPA
jgi:hypothetical protein